MKTSVSKASLRAADLARANNPSGGGSNRVRRRKGNQHSPDALLDEAWMPDRRRDARLSGVIRSDTRNPSVIAAWDHRRLGQLT